LFHRGSGRKIASGDSGDVQILIDGADNQKTGIITNPGSMQKAWKPRFDRPGGRRARVEITHRFLYNPIELTPVVQ